MRKESIEIVSDHKEYFFVEICVLHRRCEENLENQQFNLPVRFGKRGAELDRKAATSVSRSTDVWDGGQVEMKARCISCCSL